MTAPIDTDRPARVVLIGVVALVIAVSVSAFIGSHQPAVIQRVKIRNTSEYDFTVEVADGRRAGWMNLTTVAHNSTDTTEDVVDQGAVWIFRFRSQGVVAGELRVGRDVLKRHDWTLDVPIDLVADLRERGVPPSA